MALIYLSDILKRAGLDLKRTKLIRHAKSDKEFNEYGLPPLAATDYITSHARKPLILWAFSVVVLDMAQHTMHRFLPPIM